MLLINQFIRRYNMKITKNVLLIILAVFVSVYSQNNATFSKIKNLIKTGSVVMNDENGERILSINEDQKLVPASIVKVLTSQIALDILGEDFRFETELFTNDNGDLIIKGNGDPFLISDEIRLIADNIKRNGIKSVNRIYLDHSYFTEELTIPGVSKSNDPYNALNGATVVNFNTINVYKDKNGNVTSGEPETPLTPLAKRKANVISRGTKQRINLSDNRADCHRYAGELFIEIFKEKGISITSTQVDELVADDSWELVYTHKNTRTISEVIRGLLKYSNNFIANQIFLTIGARKVGTPASLEKGKKIFEQYIIDKLHLSSEKLRMVEGSGISRNNMLSGNIMVEIMERFKPNADLLSLKKGQLVKSGTLTGVYNYAGYIKTSKGLRSFSIITNQGQNYRDSILSLLAKYEI